MDSLLDQFLQEARENLAFIEQNIDKIGSSDPELLNSIFRAAHTLKGGSGIVGFESLKEITHHAEDLLDMLRSGQIEFKESMREVLYDAFDEVMNLVEAAEESGEIVVADEETVERLIKNLNDEMGKTLECKTAWSLPFTEVSDVQNLINIPLSFLRGVQTQKILFKNPPIDEEFCSHEHLYAILFDIDESCMVYGNDPLYALSLLCDKVLGIYSCMSDENAKSVLSGTEDEEGLLLRVRIVAYVYATYEEIEDSLFNFIDELQFLPLDVAALLSLSVGEGHHKLELLKELSALGKTNDIAAMVAKVEKSLELIGKETLQYAQLQRFLDIAGLIDGRDTSKLAPFFAELYKGELYTYEEVFQEDTAHDAQAQNLHEQEPPMKMDAAFLGALEDMLHQQYKSLKHIDDEGFKRTLHVMQKIRKFIPQIPENISSKDKLSAFLESYLQLSSQAQQNIAITQTQKETKEDSKEEVKEVLSQEFPSVKEQTKKEDAAKSVVGKTVKIEQKSIDSLMNVVGELLVAKNSLPYLADNVNNMSHEIIKREIMEKYIFINRLSEQLQDLIMSMRMLPISYVFDRYPKLVRDISKKLEKKVNLEMEGGDTKLDKNMIEMLADPMIHIMRNSLDHGIETPDAREKKGKNPMGTVKLQAYAESDRIVIEIIDDGAGIDVEKLANKVLTKGLLTHEQIDALSEDEMAELVLLPGLSTVDTISEFSGRGVGMDVVKKSIEGFGGNIKIKTRKNMGTTITLSIPVSLAVTSLLHIQMNGINYGIPMDSVSETVKLEREEIKYMHNEPFVYIRGDVIPLLFIKSMFNEQSSKNEQLSIVILNIKNNLLALVVNKFIGQLDVVQKPLSGIFEHHPIFTGTALLGNGEIIMALDPLGLLRISQKLKQDIKIA
ncbi:chemotaxis protein CheA [bacterium]|nr:chemotaxis protein CheA [bacterium]MBU1994603.1 chemotaxis protein CheA [bacterium]